MNSTLLAALRGGVTRDNRKRISKLIQDSGAVEHPLIQELSEVELSKIMNIACASVADVNMAIQAQRELSWESLYGGTEFAYALQDLMKNPALSNYTLAVAIMTCALLSNQPAEAAL